MKEKLYRCKCIEKRIAEMFGRDMGESWSNIECPFCREVIE